MASTTGRSHGGRDGGTCWWERYFGSDDYLRLEGVPGSSLMEQCVDFICDALRIGTGSRVLDVGCGTGRIAGALARRGCLVTGVDSSDYMVGLCRELATPEPRFTILRMDFREMAFVGAFDAVVCWSNTLGYGSRKDDSVAIRLMVQALRPGGALLIDLHNLAWYRKNAPGKSWEETDECFILYDVAYDADQKMVSRNIILPKDREPPREYVATFLQYPPEEIAGVLQSAGARDIRFFGDACASGGGPLFSTEGYGEKSHVMIVTARKDDT